MRFHSFLIKYGEIGIKGKNRYLFEDALVRQIRFALKDVDGEFNVHKAQGECMWTVKANTITKRLWKFERVLVS